MERHRPKLARHEFHESTRIKIMNNIMLDLETFGNKPGCIITAIGAVEFGCGSVAGPMLGREFYVRVDACDAQRHGLTLDADTVLWWLAQSEAARWEMTAPGAQLLTKSLYAFGDFYRGVLSHDGKPAAVWGNGSDFDNIILATAYDVTQLERPWEHYQNRCYRTVKNLHPEIKLTRTGTAHNALDDAKSQALHLMQMCPEI